MGSDHDETRRDEEIRRGMDRLADLAAERGTSPAKDGSEPHRHLGDFELLREIGRGGMGVVYEARQTSLNRRVALKVLPPGLGLTGEAVRRFHREAQAAAKLHHTNIVPVHAIGEEEGCHYYAMELIDGQALSEVLRDLTGSGTNVLLDATVTRMTGTEETPDPAVSTPSQSTSGITSLSDTSSSSRKWFDAVAKLTAEVADALNYAHGRGVIHRDIKPANLMLSGDGRLCITDFGLARVAQEPGMTVSGSLMGTPAYMSPEQIASGRMKLDHRTDVYSLGAVLYEMLTHRRPFPGESREEILGGILTKDPRPPRRFNPRIPVDLETICQKAMEKDPDKRYATAGEFAEDLRRYLGHGLIKARRAGIAKRAWKSIRRHPVAAISVLAAVLVAGFGTIAWQAFSGRQVSDIERMVSEARLLMIRGEYREALAEIDGILAADPSNLDARLIRSRLEIYRWHWWDAVEQAREVLDTDPDNWEAHLLIAAAAKRGGLNSVSVKEHLAAAKERTPDTADVFLLRGSIAHEDGRYREAIEWLDRALELDPGHALALEVRSDTYVALKDLPAALADAERLAAARPRGSEGPKQAGFVYKELHDEARALEALSRAIELDPENPVNFLHRSEVHQTRGQTEECIADLTRAIELDERVDSFFRNRGDAYRKTHKYDLSISDYRRAIEINPDNLLAYGHLFWAYWESDRRDEASAVLDELEERAGNWVDEVGLAWYQQVLAVLYSTLEDYDRAVTEAERMVELRPGWVDAHRAVMNVRRKTVGQAAIAGDCDRLAALELDLPGEFYERAQVMRTTCDSRDQALADLNRAIELSPNWSEPYRERSRIFQANGRWEEALADLDRAIELTPSWIVLTYNRGQIHARMERFELALADYERSVELGAEGPNLRRDQATALLRLGRVEDAVAVVDDYMENHPDSANGHSVRESVLYNAGRLDESLRSTERLVELSPGNPIVYLSRASMMSHMPGQCDRVRSDLARAQELATHPISSAVTAMTMITHIYYNCPELYDAEKTLELTGKGVAFAPKTDLLSFHGAALYRNGEFAEALNVLRKADEQSIQEVVPTLFFLAMTSSRLGETRQARSYYDRAVERMNATFPKNPIFIQIQDEAKEVLGVDS